MELQLVQNTAAESAYTLIEFDAPGYTAYITDASNMAAPHEPETSEIRFTIRSNSSVEPVVVVIANGRAGLIEWYVENVGYDPDADEGIIPILELVERVAGHLLLRAAGADAIAA